MQYPYGMDDNDVDVRISRRKGKWTFELFIGGPLFANGSADSLIDCAEIANVIIVDKVDMPASYLAEFDDA